LITECRPLDVQFAELLTYSYQRIVGTSMLPSDQAGADAARWLYEDAPFALLAQDTSTDPRFVYANRKAQRCFEYSWDEFVVMPARLSAHAADQEHRRKFLEGVLQQGYADNYRGLRIAKSGRRFWIEDTTVWNLVDRNGILQGQAALVPRWNDV
jgi:PAS domain S-box-containing protein